MGNILGNVQIADGSAEIITHVISFIQSESRMARFENVSGSACLLKGLFG